MLYPVELRALGNGRGREIRTPDILLPKQARYQTALYPDVVLVPEPRDHTDAVLYRQTPISRFACSFAPPAQECALECALDGEFSAQTGASKTAGSIHSERFRVHYAPSLLS